MKIKRFECLKSIRNYKKILGMSDAWSTSRLSHRPSKPAYYIVDCRISRQQQQHCNSAHQKSIRTNCLV